MTMPGARRSLLAAVAAIVSAAPPLLAQPPAAAPPTVTQVMAVLTVPATADRARVTAVLPDEVRATVRLYLDGKVQQWYGRADGRGVMFILNATSITDATALMEQLPLTKAGLATFEYTALTPLTPLRVLLAEPTQTPAR